MTGPDIEHTTAIPAGCRFCPKPAVARCTACGLPFCADHGSRLCFNCLAPTGQTVPPTAVMPSGLTYYVALLLLVVGVVLAGVQTVRLAPRLKEVVLAAPAATSTPSPRAGPTPTLTPAPATPTPTGTPAPPPTPTPVRDYVVQPGDTLWTIAQQFGVSVDDLARANGIANPNAVTLQVGQTLRIPNR